MLIDFLQHLHRKEDELDLACHTLTAEIDQLKEQNKHPLYSPIHSMFKPIIADALEKEYGKEKPYQQALFAIAEHIFKLDKNKIDIIAFPMLMRLLKSIYTTFDETNQLLEKPTHSMRFC